MQTFKVIKLGTNGLNIPDDFRRALVCKGVIGCEAAGFNDVLSDPGFTAAAAETELRLVAPSLAELGFTNVPDLKSVYHCAKEQGLKLCPWEAGPQFRLQYADQPMDERLIVALELADGSSNFPLFDVGRNDSGLYLRGYYAFPGNLRALTERFVFRQC